MMLAVGPYSGPRAICGAVAQLAKNATHVPAAIRRVVTLAFSSLINVGIFGRLAMIAKNYSARSKFSYETLGLRSGDSRVLLGTTVQRIKHFAQESSFFALE